MRLFIQISSVLLLALLLPGLLNAPAQQLSQRLFGEASQQMADHLTGLRDQYIADIRLNQAEYEAEEAAREAAQRRAAQDTGRIAPPGPDRELGTNEGDADIYYHSSAGASLQRDSRHYLLPNGDSFYQQRISYSEDAPDNEPVVAAMIRLQGGEGMIRRYDSAAEQWYSSALAEGVFENGMLIVETDGQSLVTAAPQAYMQRQNQMLEALPQRNGSIEIRRDGNGWLFILYAQAVPAGRSDYFYYICEEQLYDWEHAHGEPSWNSYDLCGDNRWCYEGYYYLAPYNYIPSGENYYHRLAAAYIATDMAFNSGRAAQGMALAMLDVMLELQNSDGWFPTHAGSQWLLSDYGVGPGFYDTRFNSDLLEALIEMSRRYEVIEFGEAALKYGAWYLRMARNCHFTLFDADNTEGWLVWDYYSPRGQSPTHCSLNHQIAEILVLYGLYELSGDPEYEETARRMLDGIAIVGDGWVKYNGSLHYAYLPDGSCGMDDYLYLTYNDLYELQELLTARYGAPDRDIAALMDTKLAWLKLNNVSGYHGWTE